MSLYPLFSRHDRRTATKYCTHIRIDMDSFAPKQIGPTYGPEGWANRDQSPELNLGGVRQRRPRPYSMELPPASEFVRFSGSSNHLIHAFLAVASLGNLCHPKSLHLGAQHSVQRLFLLRLSMPPTATHQQDNSYGGSAIWRVSKFVIPLIRIDRRRLNCDTPL